MIHLSVIHFSITFLKSKARKFSEKTAAHVLHKIVLERYLTQTQRRQRAWSTLLNKVVNQSLQLSKGFHLGCF